MVMSEGAAYPPSRFAVFAVYRVRSTQYGALSNGLGGNTAGTFCAQDYDDAEVGAVSASASRRLRFSAQSAGRGTLNSIGPGPFSLEGLQTDSSIAPEHRATHPDGYGAGMNRTGAVVFTAHPQGTKRQCE